MEQLLGHKYMTMVQKGFTLIELLVVIAVIAVLSGVVLVAIDPLEQINRAKDADMRQRTGQVFNAVQQFAAQSSMAGSAQYPDSLQVLIDNGDLNEIPPGVNYYLDRSSNCGGLAYGCMAVYLQTMASKQSIMAAGCRTVGYGTGKARWLYWGHIPQGSIWDCWGS